MIVKVHRRGRARFLLVTKARTYEHDTLAAAKAQETAINIAKARRSGHRIPRQPAKRLTVAYIEKLARKHARQDG